MTVDSLRDEIYKKFPPTDRHILNEGDYTVHSSESELKEFVDDLLSVGWVIGEMPKDRYAIKKFQLPNLGIVSLITDLDEGFKIIKNA